MNVNTQYYFKGGWRERNEIFSMLDAVIIKVGKFEYYGTCDDGRKTLAIIKYGKDIDTQTAIKEAIKEDKEKEAGIITIFDL